MADEVLLFFAPVTAFAASLAIPALRREMKERRRARRLEKKLREMGFR